MDSFDAFWCLFGAIIIDLYAGSWFRAGQSLWHPKNIVGRWVEKLCEKLDRQGRSSSVLLVRGALSVLCTISLAGLAGTVIHLVLMEIPLGWVLELLILTSLVSVGRLWGMGTLLASSLESGSREEARRQLGELSPRDATYSDSDEITRLGIEAVITNFISDFVGPVLFYALLGLPGVFIYHGLRSFSSCGASREYLIFGKHLVGAVDAPLSWLGGILFFCAILLFSATSARRTLRQGRRLILLGTGIPYSLTKSLVAGALGITLEGPRLYAAGPVERPYLGSGGAPSPGDLVQVVKLALAAAGLTAALVVTCAVLL